MEGLHVLHFWCGEASWRYRHVLPADEPAVVALDKAVVAGKAAVEGTDAQVCCAGCWESSGACVALFLNSQKLQRTAQRCAVRRCAVRWSFCLDIGQRVCARAPQLLGILPGPAVARARTSSQTTHTNAGTQNLQARRLSSSADPASKGARTLARTQSRGTTADTNSKKSR
jgi:hypothetical protein